MQQTCVIVTGRVQGVSFRAWTQEEAQALGLRGWVRNRDDGSVEAVLGGTPEAVEAMVARLREGPRAARVEALDREPADGALPEGFEIRR
ncbi:acylphosphatase [Citreimonas salinaria]|uniref:Acylphosphatase n=1 Tax=Citreimonas salinaria TaxID=321339 RepID=A0A1H3JPG2_9RHOB|nr:acylphosphatase [Citreimonas salinaria]SDY41791.1 acylphosphatase [Citreimonas salinaria]